MSRHQFDLVQCMKQPGTHIGLLCLSCDGRCPICDSMVKPHAKVRVCDECHSGHLSKRCILCSAHLGDDAEAGTPAYYCYECVVQDKHREGCPRIVNASSSKADMIFNKRKSKGLLTD
ncbi:Pre-mRNA-splicing factor ini1 [Candidozyma auris]|nr:hypothetical protein CJJ07_002892 [[Candida] auris]GBL48797.1 hypothetical protein CAJCM15448_10710 [[Candida] auris]